MGSPYPRDLFPIAFSSGLGAVPMRPGTRYIGEAPDRMTATEVIARHMARQAAAAGPRRDIDLSRIRVRVDQRIDRMTYQVIVQIPMPDGRTLNSSHEIARENLENTQSANNLIFEATRVMSLAIVRNIMQYQSETGDRTFEAMPAESVANDIQERIMQAVFPQVAVVRTSDAPPLDLRPGAVNEVGEGNALTVERIQRARRLLEEGETSGSFEVFGRPDPAYLAAYNQAIATLMAQSMDAAILGSISPREGVSRHTDPEDARIKRYKAPGYKLSDAPIIKEVMPGFVEIPVEDREDRVCAIIEKRFGK